jgi:hypothetical protein
MKINDNYNQMASNTNNLFNTTSLDGIQAHSMTICAKLEQIG